MRHTFYTIVLRWVRLLKESINIIFRNIMILKFFLIDNCSCYIYQQLDTLKKKKELIREGQVTEVE